MPVRCWDCAQVWSKAQSWGRTSGAIPLFGVFLVPEGLGERRLMGFPACAQVSQKLQVNIAIVDKMTKTCPEESHEESSQQRKMSDFYVLLGGVWKICTM